MDAVTAIRNAGKESDQKNNILEEVAQKILNISLEETNRNNRNLHLSAIKEVLKNVFLAGCEVGLTIKK
jgi:transcriptional regulator of met regulon